MRDVSQATKERLCARRARSRGCGREPRSERFDRAGCGLTILPEQGIEIVAIAKKIMVGRRDALGLLADRRSERFDAAGFGPATKWRVTV